MIRHPGRRFRDSKKKKADRFVAHRTLGDIEGSHSRCNSGFTGGWDAGIFFWDAGKTVE